jgi:hypothetical protein
MSANAETPVPTPRIPMVEPLVGNRKATPTPTVDTGHSAPFLQPALPYLDSVLNCADNCWKS